MKLVRRLWKARWEKLCKIHGSDNLLVLLGRKNICSYGQQVTEKGLSVNKYMKNRMLSLHMDLIILNYFL